jgi:flagellar basal body-associated protein FliL
MRRGEGETLWIIVGLVLALIVALAVIIWMGSSQKGPEKQVIDLKNQASDAVTNAQTWASAPAIRAGAAVVILPRLLN